VYGPGISLVDHAEGGAVIYIWGTLLDTALGLDMMRDAVVYAGAATATEEEAEAVAAVTGRAQALRERAGGLRAQLGEAAPDDALGRYLGREVARQAARVELLVGMAKVRRVEAAEARAASMDEALATVERRLGEATR